MSPSLNPAIGRHNLDALAAVDPGLAALLEALQPHLPRAEPATTRDGCISLRVETAGGAWRWLGDSSVPAVRARAILERFEPGTHNVLLPGIAAGFEVHFLLNSLSPTQAVFVWEPEAENLAFACMIHDWADALRSRRLIFLCCPRDQLSDRLSDWLNDHTGHLCPERILAWPWSAPADLAALKWAIENAFQGTESRRQQELATVGTRLSTPDGSRQTPQAETRPVALLTMSAHPDALLLNRKLCTACPESLYVIPVTLQAPGDVHPLAWSRRLIEAAPDGLAAVLCTSHTRSAFRGLFPQEIPFIAWLTGPPHPQEKPGPLDLLYLTRERHRQRAIGQGWPSEQVHVLPLPSLVIPEDVPDDAPSDRPLDVVVFADLPLTTPHAYGITMVSHVHLWNMILEGLRHRIDTFEDGHFPALLEAAVRQTGVPLEDPEIRHKFGHLLGSQISTTLLWVHLMAHLRATSFKIAVYGYGWDAIAPHEHRGPIPALPERLTILRQSRVLLLADPSGNVGNDIHLAAAAGSAVVSRGHTADSEPGGQATLYAPPAEMLIFRSVSTLPGLLHRVTRDADFRHSLTAAARRRWVETHLPRHRLDILRAGVSSLFAHRHR